MAQTPDGLLWFSNPRGLYSFDGIAFRLFEQDPSTAATPLPNSHYLLATRSGDLWLFAFHGAPVRIRDGRVRLFGRVEGAELQVLGWPQEDSHGTIWAVLNGRQIVYLGRDEEWHPLSDPPLTAGHLTTLFMDSSDTTWIVIDEHLYRKDSSDVQFKRIDIVLSGATTIRQGQKNDLWISSSGVGAPASLEANLLRVDKNGFVLYSTRVSKSVSTILPVSDGSLWVLTQSNELLRLHPYAGRKQLDAEVESSNEFELQVAPAELHQNALLSAANGGIWVAGIGGAEQFTRASLVPAMIPAPVGNWQSCLDSSAALWIADPRGVLYRRVNGILEKVKGERNVDALLCQRDGSLIISDERGLELFSGRHIMHLPRIPQLGALGLHKQYVYTGATHMPDKRIIAAVAGNAIGHGLWELNDGKWTRFLQDPDQPEVTALRPEADGGLLIGFREGKVQVFQQGTSTVMPIAGTPLGALGFADTVYGTMAYGSHGLALKTVSTFRRIAFADPENGVGITGVVQTRNGDVWLNGAEGIVKIPATEMQQFCVHNEHLVQTLNVREGNFVGPSLTSLFSDTAHVDPDGRLWFATVNGVVSLNPDRPASAELPKLAIRRIYADGRPIGNGLSIGPDVDTLRLQYIGVDLSNPQAVSYRYQLVGADQSWQDVGTRNEAIYTHLRPGKYVFRVMASNAPNLWTAPVQSVPFTVLPRYYQTLWFDVLCGCVLLLLLWVAVNARLRFLSADIRIRAEERADERIRIARDLHDTLLQGVQGLLLAFHAAAERVPEFHESKRALEHALSVAENIILEGRDRVKGLRTLHVPGDSLQIALEALSKDLDPSRKVVFEVIRSGKERCLFPEVAAESFLIAREAVINAYRHAKPTKIQVRLNFAPQVFSLVCLDDGRGIEVKQLRAAEETGHWGFRGMAERSERLGGSFEYSSAPGKGTFIQISLKAGLAYQDHHLLWRPPL